MLTTRCVSPSCKGLVLYQTRGSFEFLSKDLASPPCQAHQSCFTSESPRASLVKSSIMGWVGVNNIATRPASHTTWLAQVKSSDGRLVLPEDDLVHTRAADLLSSVAVNETSLSIVILPAVAATSLELGRCGSCMPLGYWNVLCSTLLKLSHLFLPFSTLAFLHKNLHTFLVLEAGTGATFGKIAMHPNFVHNFVPYIMILQFAGWCCEQRLYHSKMLWLFQTQVTKSVNCENGEATELQSWSNVIGNGLHASSTC